MVADKMKELNTILSNPLFGLLAQEVTSDDKYVEKVREKLDKSEDKRSAIREVVRQVSLSLPLSFSLSLIILPFYLSLSFCLSIFLYQIHPSKRPQELSEMKKWPIYTFEMIQERMNCFFFLLTTV